MKISIYGSGCKKCSKLYELAEEAISELSIECDLEKVSDYQEIMKAGVMLTPALGIDGEIIFSKNLPKVKEIAEEIKKRWQG